LLFYESIGAKLLLISFFVSLARALELFLKPVMAYISDNSTSAMGRRKPFMLFGCLFYAAFLVGMFLPPKSSSYTNSLWFGVFYVMFFMADTVCNVPYLALGPELTRNNSEREKLYIIFYTFQYCGVLFAATAPILINRLISVIF
jgi:Na+/melibiose symporter-like transporter